ncbi:MAG: LysR family transcriptional regulator [Desulfovibrio sp.]
MLPDFNRLRVFYYIYKTGSSTSAGKELHLTQSGVSQHLKKLEQELDYELFTRVNKKLIPTSKGIALFNSVKRFVDDLESTMEDSQGVQLRIGAPVEFGKTYFPRIFSSFQTENEDVSFHLELDDPQTLFRKLGNGELDFAYIDILPFKIQTSKEESLYQITPLIREEFILACSKKYYNEHIKQSDFRTLKNLDYISFRKDTALIDSWFNLHHKKIPESLKIRFSVDSALGIISAIEADVGLGVSVSHFMSQQISSGSIIPINAGERQLENTIAYVQLKNKKLSKLEDAFQRHILFELQKISSLNFE